MIKQQAGANSGDGFDFKNETKKLGSFYTWSICLTKDEKYLLVGSAYYVNIVETATREVKKQLELEYNVMTINLIEHGTKAIIAQEWGDLSILDLETLEISSNAENITNGKKLKKIIVI